MKLQLVSLFFLLSLNALSNFDLDEGFKCHIEENLPDIETSTLTFSKAGDAYSISVRRKSTDGEVSYHPEFHRKTRYGCYILKNSAKCVNLKKISRDSLIYISINKIVSSQYYFGEDVENIKSLNITSLGEIPFSECESIEKEEAYN